MSLEHVRRSKIFRLIAIALIFDFIFSQTLYAQDQFHVQEGIHIYTPVEEVDAKRLGASSHPDPERSEGEGSQVVDSSAPPLNPTDSRTEQSRNRSGFGAAPPQNDDRFWNKSLEMLDLNLFISFCSINATKLWR